MNRSTIDLWVGIFVAIGIGAILFLSLKVGQPRSPPRTRRAITSRPRSTTSAASSCARRSRRRAWSSAASTASSSTRRPTRRVVSMRIDQGYQFSRDTIASILTSGLLGEVYIGLDTGGDPQMLADGGRIAQDAVGGGAREADRPVHVRQGGRREREMMRQCRSDACSSRGAARLLLGGCATTVGPDRRRTIRSSRGTARCTRSTRWSTARSSSRSRRRTSTSRRGRSSRASATSSATSTTSFSAINDLLQGKLDKAGNDMGRVMVNTFFGLGGIIDIASDAGIEKGNEDFGQTFGVWGIPQGPYLFIPLLGPTTVRDGTGLDRPRLREPARLHRHRRAGAQRPVRHRRSSTPARRRSQSESLVDQAALDRYTFIRRAYLQRRRVPGVRRQAAAGRTRTTDHASQRPTFASPAGSRWPPSRWRSRRAAHAQDAPDALVKRVSEDVLQIIKTDPRVQPGDQARIKRGDRHQARCRTSTSSG